MDVQIKTITKTVYVASDGREFEDETKCLTYERNLQQCIVKERKKVMGMANSLKTFCERYAQHETEYSVECSNAVCPFSEEGKCQFIMPPSEWTFVKERL